MIGFQRRDKERVLRRYLRTWSRTFPYVRPYWKLGGASFVVTILSALMALLQPWPLAFLLDSVLGHDGQKKGVPHIVTSIFGTDTHNLILFAVLFGLAVALLTGLLSIVNEYVHTKLDASMVFDFRSDLFENAEY